MLRPHSSEGRGHRFESYRVRQRFDQHVICRQKLAFELGVNAGLDNVSPTKF